MARKTKALQASEDPKVQAPEDVAPPAKPEPPPPLGIRERASRPGRGPAELTKVLTQMVLDECAEDHWRAVDQAMARARYAVRMSWRKETGKAK